jgi:hypothetical protein
MGQLEFYCMCPPVPGQAIGDPNQWRRQEIWIRGAKEQNIAIRGARAEKSLDFMCSLAQESKDLGRNIKS